jgi:hypothetical protein
MRVFFPLQYDSKIVAQSRELVAQSRELLQRSEPYVNYPYPLRNEDTGLCIELESGEICVDGKQRERPSGTSRPSNGGGQNAAAAEPAHHPGMRWREYYIAKLRAEISQTRDRPVSRVGRISPTALRTIDASRA